MQTTSKIILGIDPGTIIMGYGIIHVSNGIIRLLDMNVLKLSPRHDHYERLQQIHHKVIQLIGEYKPTCCAIEAPFFGKNVQSMLKLGRAQGVAIAAAIQSGLTVSEYSPKKIKMSITGNGNAGKEQVMKMLQRLMTIENEPKYMDASDALAAAVCHHFQDNVILKNPKAPGWKNFITQNPERIRK